MVSAAPGTGRSRPAQAGGSRLHPLKPGTVRSVVVARLEDNEVVAVDQVDETVLVSDTPRPGAGGSVHKPLRLAYAGAGVTQAGVDQGVDTLEDPPVGPLPVLVVLPGTGVPDKPRSVLPVEAVLLGSARARPVIGVKQPAGVGRGAEQVGGLLPGRVLVSGHEDDAALP